MPAVVPTAPSACKSPTPGGSRFVAALSRRRQDLPHPRGGVVSADRPGAATREAAPPPGESFR